MADEQLVRMVPVLSARELAPVVAFYEWIGLTVTSAYDGYVILATDAVADDAVEVHLSQWDDHDPLRTAGTVYLRVRNAAQLHDRLHRDLLARQDAIADLVRLTDIEDKPWGMHEFAVIDPAGWLVRVGSPVR